MEEDTLKDKILICKDCRRKFPFTAREQKFFGQKGWPDPVRCHYCQRQKKILMALKDGTPIADKIQFSEICSRCGRRFYSKFKARPNENIFCDDCWLIVNPKRKRLDEEGGQENTGVAKGKTKAR